MTLRKTILATLFLAPCSLPLAPLMAQEGSDDVGVWAEIGVEKAINKKWDVGVDLEYRAQDKARFSAGLSTSYKVCKYLKLGIGYNYLHSYRPEKRNEKNNIEENPDNYHIGYNLYPEYWFPRHRFSVEATGSIKVWNWLKISVRERYQLTHRRERNIDRYKYRQEYTTKVDLVYPEGNPDDPFDPANWADPEVVYTYNVPEGEPTGVWDTKNIPAYTDQVLRSRIKLEFDKKRNPFSPFISAEAHNSVRKGDHMLLQKVRAAAGLSYKFRKRNEVSLSYVITFDIYDTDEEVVERVHDRRHAINIGYKYSF